MDNEAEIMRAAEDVRERFNYARAHAPEFALMIPRRGTGDREFKNRVAAELMMPTIVQQLRNGETPSVKFYGPVRQARDVAAIVSDSPQLAEYDAEAKEAIVEEVFPGL